MYSGKHEKNEYSPNENVEIKFRQFNCNVVFCEFVHKTLLSKLLCKKLILLIGEVCESFWWGKMESIQQSLECTIS